MAQRKPNCPRGPKIYRCACHPRPCIEATLSSFSLPHELFHRIPQSPERRGRATHLTLFLALLLLTQYEPTVQHRAHHGPRDASFAGGRSLRYGALWSTKGILHGVRFATVFVVVLDDATMSSFGLLREVAECRQRIPLSWQIITKPEPTPFPFLVLSKDSEG